MLKQFSTMSHRHSNRSGSRRSHSSVSSSTKKNNTDIAELVDPDVELQADITSKSTKRTSDESRKKKIYSQRHERETVDDQMKTANENGEDGEEERDSASEETDSESDDDNSVDSSSETEVDAHEPAKKASKSNRNYTSSCKQPVLCLRPISAMNTGTRNSLNQRAKKKSATSETPLENKPVEKPLDVENKSHERSNDKTDTPENKTNKSRKSEKNDKSEPPTPVKSTAESRTDTTIITNVGHPPAIPRKLATSYDQFIEESGNDWDKWCYSIICNLSNQDNFISAVDKISAHSFTNSFLKREIGSNKKTDYSQLVFDVFVPKLSFLANCLEKYASSVPSFTMKHVMAVVSPEDSRQPRSIFRHRAIIGNDALMCTLKSLVKLTTPHHDTMWLKRHQLQPIKLLDMAFQTVKNSSNFDERLSAHRINQRIQQMISGVYKLLVEDFAAREKASRDGQIMHLFGHKQGAVLLDFLQGLPAHSLKALPVGYISAIFGTEAAEMYEHDLFGETYAIENSAAPIKQALVCLLLELFLLITNLSSVLLGGTRWNFTSDDCFLEMTEAETSDCEINGLLIQFRAMTLADKLMEFVINIDFNAEFLPGMMCKKILDMLIECIKINRWLTILCNPEARIEKYEEVLSLDQYLVVHDMIRFFSQSSVHILKDPIVAEIKYTNELQKFLSKRVRSTVPVDGVADTQELDRPTQNRPTSKSNQYYLHKIDTPSYISAALLFPLQ